MIRLNCDTVHKVLGLGTIVVRGTRAIVHVMVSAGLRATASTPGSDSTALR